VWPLARSLVRGTGKGVSVREVRRWAAVVVFAAALALVGVAAGAALHVSPASAFDAWEHDGTTGCLCHLQGKPTDASCTSCHVGFKSIKGTTCWTCHYPGQDTSSLSTTSADCAQACHLYTGAGQYTTDFTHSTNPHLGSLPQCLGCHSPSSGIADPGASPHHNDGSPSMQPCSSCHAEKQHVGKVSCTSCHKTANDFHTYAAKSPGFTKCGGCHKMKHAGKTIAVSKCATCHKGTGSGAQKLAQHSTTVTKGFTCNQSGCHSKQLHASAYGSGIKSCTVCHDGSTYHGSHMAIPSSSVCVGCHASALSHSNHYACTVCHAGTVHSAKPHAGSH
jgi:hypothetical protein